MKLDLSNIDGLVGTILGAVATMVTAWIVNVRKTSVQEKAKVEMAKVNAESADVEELKKQLKIAQEAARKFQDALEQAKLNHTNEIAELNQRHATEIADLKAKHAEEIAIITNEYDNVKSTFDVLYGTFITLLRNAGSEEGVALVNGLRDLMNKRP